MAQPAFPDDLLEEIFLRLPAAADLARASVACVSFRRVITAHPFLRRFRTLHPPPLLGILCRGLTTAQPPHPSAAAAATLADADFSCAFLPPSPDGWCRRDVRDGRALFSPRLQGSSAVRNSMYDPRDLVTEFAVCDPLHRRYLLLPVLPDHLADQVQQPDILQCEPFLAPPGDDEHSSFRNLSSSSSLPVPEDGSLILLRLMFLDAGHRTATTPMDASVGTFIMMMPRCCSCSTRAGWTSLSSTFHLRLATVEAGEGRLGMLTIDQSKRGAHRLLYAVHSQDGNGANQWQSKSAIPLPENYRYCIRGVAGGYLLLTGHPENNRPIVDYFSLDLQTLQVEWFCQTGDYVIIGDLYADLPPSLSPPTL